MASLSFLIGLPAGAQAQFSAPGQPLPEDLPATGNIDDLDGLQERRLGDWFPQDSISRDSQTILEINSDSPPLPGNEQNYQRQEEKNWPRHSPGEPKSGGAGIPLGTF